ncbi:MAG: PD-(D/E)XK nuclease family protein, partial [Smithellaceae bacterium]|nr:PD-(D/E)XK nuclease family protein [Smithellaceae bacterium]
MLPKSYISVSQIQSYLRCPAQYFFRYIRNITFPPNRALTVGKVVHSANEFNYRQKMVSGLDLPLEDIQEYTAAEFEAHMQATEWGEDDPGQAKDEAIILASLYRNEVSPKVMPAAVELRVKIEFENVPYSILGFIDLIDGDGFIRDTKTSRKTPSENEVIKSIQLTAYTLAYQCEFGEDPAGVKLDYLVSVKKPKYVLLEASRSQADVDRFLRLVGKVVGAISFGHFYPNPTNFMCSEKAC